jgi:uncharacterized protein YbjT (DUF2867 family)
MKTILVVGASGFIGRRLVHALRADGFAVRCLARKPEKLNDLAAAGCEIVRGDISDASAVRSAMDLVHAVYVSIHTLAPQKQPAERLRFMDVEKLGVQNVIAAGQARDVKQVVYVTSLGITADATSEWLRERWHTEQLLLNSAIDATVIRPGFVIGTGGRGFDTVVSNAKRRVAVSMGGDRPLMRTIAVDDLIYYLIGVLDEPRAYRQCFEVGNDNVLSINELTDGVADVLGRGHPVKTKAPMGLLGACAPIIERLGKLAPGAMKGLVEGLKVDSIGDPSPIRAILPRPLLSFRQAVEKELLT